MRMQDLVRETGLPRTAIHHYIREGLLPPSTKTAPNAALYGPEHVERLKLIRALRGDELGPLPMSTIRLVLEMVEGGVEPEVAATLCSLPAGHGEPSGRKGRRGSASLSGVARDTGLSLSTARSLQDAGLLLGRPGAGGARVYDQADVTAAKVIAEILSNEAIKLEDLDPIGELVGELVRYEKVLATLATARSEPEEAAERRRSMFRGLHALHTYLFARLVAEPDAG